MGTAVQSGTSDVPAAAALAGGVVRRRALFERLERAGRVAQVSAPAGSGKTVPTASCWPPPSAAVAQWSHVVRDDAAELLHVIERAAPDIDVVLTSGGISAGAYEVVMEALAPHGIEFTQLAMQPGRPRGAGVFGGIPVVALPGNPVSALSGQVRRGC